MSSRPAEAPVLEKRTRSIRLEWWVPLSYPEKSALIFAVFMAHAFFFATLYLPLLYDASGYFEAGKEILARGLFSKNSLSHWRTYGYPFFLSRMIRISDQIGIAPRLLIFEVQLAVYLAALAACREVLHYARISAGVSRAFFYCFCLNPFVYILLAMALTEGPSIATALLLFSAMVYINAVPKDSAGYTVGVVVGSLFAGGMVIIRPANTFVLPVWFFSIYLSTGNPFRPFSAEALKRTTYVFLLAAVTCFVPAVPQVVNNVTLFGTATPLVSYPVGDLQAKTGIEWMKYGSAFIPGKDSRLIYENPFAKGTSVNPTKPFEWYFEHPGIGTLTLALHVYNVLDQDLPMVYNTRLVPVYYPAVSLANQTVIGFAIAAVALFFRRASAWSETTRRLLMLAVAFVLCHLALHSLFSVECRYGVIALLMIYPLGVLGAVALVRSGGSIRILGITTVVVYVVFAAWLTGWVRDHAPAIRAERQEAELLTSFNDSGSLVTSNLREWVGGNFKLTAAGEAQLRSTDGASVSILQHQVPVEPNTNYVIQFAARAETPLTAPLSVDFFGNSYDNPEQNLVTADIGPAYQIVTAKWNSGPAVPPIVLLRFATLSQTVLEFKHVTIRKQP